MDVFSLLVKPASADCNLRCRYCFYLDRAGLYPAERIHRMSGDVLRRMVASYLQTEQPCYSFGWQGGEPALMGLPFFREVTEMQQAYGRPGSSVANGFQTNGTLIDDDWAEHFARFRFLVGVSVDGPAKLHDRSRRDAGGLPTHARVLEGIAAMRRHGVAFNVLTLVNSANVKYPEEIYDYLCELGVQYHQYIECVEFEGGTLQPFAITAQAWGEFLCRIFDRWYRRDTRRVSVRLFDTILAQLVHGQSITCAAGKSCDQYFVVEYNGDVYPCDFNVRADLLVGNITTTEWQALRQSPIYHQFAACKTQWHARCGACPWQRFCNGDCPKNRAGGVPGALSHLCAGWRRFYAHAIPRLEELAQELRGGGRGSGGDR